MTKMEFLITSAIEGYHPRQLTIERGKDEPACLHDGTNLACERALERARLLERIAAQARDLAHLESERKQPDEQMLRELLHELEMLDKPVAHQ